MGQQQSQPPSAQPPGKSPPSAPTTSTTLPTYTKQQVAAHNTEHDCWLVVSNKVYDLTHFAHTHPGGGDIIWKYAGRDATSEFINAMHPQYAVDEMETDYLIGRLERAPKPRVAAAASKPTATAGAAAAAAATTTTTTAAAKSPSQSARQPSPTSNHRIDILYASQGGTCKRIAENLQQTLQLRLAGSNTPEQYRIELSDAATIDTENLKTMQTLILITSTYTDGQPPVDAALFFRELQEMCVDFRVDRDALRNTHYAVLGLGSTLYEEHYNAVGRQADQQLASLGARRLCDFGEADEQSNEQIREAQQWIDELLLPALITSLTQPSDATAITTQTDNADVSDAADESASDVDTDAEEPEKKDVTDLEDIAKSLAAAKLASTQSATDTAGNNTAKEMLTKNLREALSHQGYKLVGTHSAVKLCRWTKASIRGRGGCYKHSLYGIESGSCMEMTPALACSNKCVFCWRHGTNPVSRDWRWKVDEPEFIVEEAVKHHAQMIKMQRGVPGVTPERFDAAKTIQHCALSLVGEPIMYPKINRLIELLHRRHISTFLVNNAQHPEAIANLDPVTQLYVSIDASTKESLKKVDRPLFTDFWERLMTSLEHVGRKQQRTVYRLTLLKSFNMSEIAEYSKLIAIGKPTFIEIKGVTFTNQSKKNMSMQDVPFHHEVRRFAEELCAYAGSQYELASEHEHSCTVLIADVKLKINGVWHTHIDYEKYHKLITAYYDSGRSKTFTTYDYCLPTPSWALMGAPEAGFDPTMERVRNRGKAAIAAKREKAAMDKQAAIEAAETKEDPVLKRDGAAVKTTDADEEQKQCCGDDCSCSTVDTDNASSIVLTSLAT